MQRPSLELSERVEKYVYESGNVLCRILRGLDCLPVVCKREANANPT